MDKDDIAEDIAEKTGEAFLDAVMEHFSEVTTDRTKLYTARMLVAGRVHEVVAELFK